MKIPLKVQNYNKIIYLQIFIKKNNVINCLIYKNLAFVKKQNVKIYIKLIVIISQ